jgi:hypothetical protein
MVVDNMDTTTVDTSEGMGTATLALCLTGTARTVTETRQGIQAGTQTTTAIHPIHQTITLHTPHGAIHHMESAHTDHTVINSHGNAMPSLP